jgi:para-nitrobenzyl esterase
MPGENMVRLVDAERAGEAYAKGASASSIEALRRMPSEKVLAASKGQRGLGWPIVDGWLIPNDQYKLYHARRYNDTPILVGYNSDEGLSFSFARTPQEYVKYVRERFGPHADNLLKLYSVGATAVTKSARDLMRDTAFGWHTWIWARLQSQTGMSKAFLYYFDQHPPRVPGSPEEDQGSCETAPSWFGMR